MDVLLAVEHIDLLLLVLLRGPLSVAVVRRTLLYVKACVRDRTTWRGARPHLLLPVGVYFRAFLVVLGKCQWGTEIVAVVGEDTFCLLCR